MKTMTNPSQPSGWTRTESDKTMDFEGQVAEAVDNITSLWTPDLVQEVANDGIIVTMEDAQDGAIVSCHNGTILWRGLIMPWAFVYLTAAKRVAKSLTRDMD